MPGRRWRISVVVALVEIQSSRVATLVENPLQLSLSLSRLTVIWLPVQRQVRRMSSSGAGF